MSNIKICGLSRMEDISAVNRALPDYIGFVFAPSRRQIDEKTAAMLKERLDLRIKAVGVFVNQEIGTVAGLYQSGVIDLVQLHGDEDADYIARLKGYCGCAVIKATGIGDTLPPLPKNADYYLFDTLSGSRGGTGKVFDWNVLRNYSGPPYFLAGGLAIANIPEAIHSLAPFCIDVSSGAETDGKKDADKIYQIVRLVRAYVD
ncbi:MAG: phosphoribosylanthranilate isomerase [Treponema sp.]|jgi:phosphoribosylanthranilate isomerase|nr:phosphoribosylanthranilate isomerase [Treponema sp.]